MYIKYEYPHNKGGKQVTSLEDCMTNEKRTKKSEQLAEKNYEPGDYKRNSNLSSGLATSHEQVSDTLTEGTVDGEIDEIDEKDVPLRKR